MYVYSVSRETQGTTIDIAILSCLRDSFVSGAEITTGNVAFANKRNGKRKRDGKLKMKVKRICIKTKEIHDS